MKTKKITHTWYYEGYASRDYKSTTSCSGYGAKSIWMMQLQYELANALTTKGWTLLSIVPMAASWNGGVGKPIVFSGTDGFLIVLEKILPEEVVDQIVKIRNDISVALHEILSESITVDSIYSSTWRGQKYTTWDEANRARINFAEKERCRLAKEANLSELLDTVVPDAPPL